MEIEVTGSSSKESFAMEVGGLKRKVVEEKDQVRVTRKTLQAVLEQCQRAIESISNSEGGIDDDDEDDKDDMDPQGEASGAGLQRDQEVDELCDLLKSRVQCSDFLEKLECARVPISENVSEEGSSWDMVNDNDLWEDKDLDLDQEDYVLVRQEDIVEGIACFMAAYLLSLKQTKDLSPNQLQEALSKTFSVKKKRESFERHGTEAKSFIMWHPGEQLQSGQL
ncbi:hypothetical protein GOBAR_DD08052 [Gossypium barbadense]|nr:hypothetical protein GOBAR_DD08052 [Gossypium barbadense]